MEFPPINLWSSPMDNQQQDREIQCRVALYVLSRKSEGVFTHSQMDKAEEVLLASLKGDYLRMRAARFNYVEVMTDWSLDEHILYEFKFPLGS
jgi:hypothetical protein